MEVICKLLGNQNEIQSTPSIIPKGLLSYLSYKTDSIYSKTKTKKNSVKPTKNIPLVSKKTHMRPIVEQDTHCVVRELVAESILVGVVHPLGHPTKTAAIGSFGDAISYQHKRRKSVNIRQSQIQG